MKCADIVTTFSLIFCCILKGASSETRCFCNEASCVQTSYMCKSMLNSCYTLNTRRGSSTTATHGCVDSLPLMTRLRCHLSGRQSQRSWAGVDDSDTRQRGIEVDKGRTAIGQRRAELNTNKLVIGLGEKDTNQVGSGIANGQLAQDVDQENEDLLVRNLHREEIRGRSRSSRNAGQLDQTEGSILLDQPMDQLLDRLDSVKMDSEKSEDGVQLDRDQEDRKRANRVDTDWSRLECCESDMCNYPAGVGSTGGEQRRGSQVGADSPVLAPAPYSRSIEGDLWFKAAVICVPVLGLFILIILIIMAARMLRADRQGAEHTTRWACPGQQFCSCGYLATYPLSIQQSDAIVQSSPNQRDVIKKSSLLASVDRTTPLVRYPVVTTAISSAQFDLLLPSSTLCEKAVCGLCSHGCLQLHQCNTSRSQSKPVLSNPAKIEYSDCDSKSAESDHCCSSIADGSFGRQKFGQLPKVAKVRCNIYDGRNVESSRPCQKIDDTAFDSQRIENDFSDRKKADCKSLDRKRTIDKECDANCCSTFSALETTSSEVRLLLATADSCECNRS